MNAINLSVYAPSLVPASSNSSAANQRLWCLAPDTVLDTPSGCVGVENLRHGNAVICEAGHAAPVRHLSVVSIRLNAAYDRRRSQSVMIQPGAIDAGIPTRPLHLPAAARVRVPGLGFAEIADLVNGATITRVEPQPSETVWHGVVCESPAALLICGLAVEGAALSAGAEATLRTIANPPTDPAPSFELPAYSRLAPARLVMAERALLLGHDRIADPGLRLLIDGETLAPECSGAWCRFMLPRGAPTRVLLLSRHAVPAQLIGNDEKRRLGVAVGRIVAGQRSIPLTHWCLGTGWHLPEHSWRWTDGAATLLLPPGVTELAFEIANTLPCYPLA